MPADYNRHLEHRPVKNPVAIATRTAEARAVLGEIDAAIDAGESAKVDVLHGELGMSLQRWVAARSGEDGAVG